MPKATQKRKFVCVAKPHTQTPLKHSIDLRMCCLLCLPIGYAYSLLHFFLMEVGFCSSWFEQTNTKRKAKATPFHEIGCGFPLAMIEQRS